eukprot:195015_1
MLTVNNSMSQSCLFLYRSVHAKNMINIIIVILLVGMCSIIINYNWIHVSVDGNINSNLIIKNQDNIWRTDFMKNYENFTSYIKPRGISDDQKIYNLFAIPYIQIDIQKHELQFCLTIAVGTGNVLSIYWASRSIAYWLGYNWRLITDLETQCKDWIQNLEFSDTNTLVLQRLQHTFLNDQLFSSFLPTYIPFDTNNAISNKQVYRMQHWIHNTLSTHSDSYCILWAHECQLLFMFYNPYFVTKFIVPEINNALNSMKTFSMNDMSITDDIVIHIRCGDIISMEWENIEYGFHSIKYYETIMNYFRWKTQSHKYNAHSTVWILTQLKDDKTWGVNIDDTIKCKQLIYGFIESDKFVSIFEPARIMVIGNETANNDFYRMVKAPLLICSPSTFCLHAALGKAAGIGYSVIPSFGPWIDLYKLTKNKDMMDWKHSDQTSKLLPENHVIIDTKTKNNFMINVKEMLEKNMTQSVNLLLNYLLKN